MSPLLFSGHGPLRSMILVLCVHEPFPHNVYPENTIKPAESRHFLSIYHFTNLENFHQHTPIMEHLDQNNDFKTKWSHSEKQGQCSIMDHTTNIQDNTESGFHVIWVGWKGCITSPPLSLRTIVLIMGKSLQNQGIVQ